jgi:hypothetical protein
VESQAVACTEGTPQVCVLPLSVASSILLNV